MLARVRSVAVIGAGASGISAITQLKARGFEVTAYEARSTAGLYDADPGECRIAFDRDGRPFVKEDPSQAPTPMYDGLHTNLPNRLMTYRNTPFATGTGMFPGRQPVLEYIQAAARAHSDVIRYGERVTRLHKPVVSKQWRLSTRKSGERAYDAVLLCNGHYSVPALPRVEGLWNWRRKISHARFYRNAQDAIKLSPSLRIMVVGNGPSGSDIAREIASALPEDAIVYVSIRTPSKWIDPDFHSSQPWFKRSHIVPPIARAEAERLTLEDGTVLDDVGLILYATGYLYTFPFVSLEDEPFASHPLVRPSGSEYPDGAPSVSNLDQSQIFYAPDPTLAFTALQWSIVPFPMAEAQARVIAAVWSGAVQLPIDLSMLPDFGKTPGRAFHKLGYPSEFDYEDAILQAIGEGEDSGKEIDEHGMNALVPWRHQLRKDALDLRREHLGW